VSAAHAPRSNFKGAPLACHLSFPPPHPTPLFASLILSPAMVSAIVFSLPPAYPAVLGVAVSTVFLNM
jgi:hypothetical protein